jgi:hypothetical protein
MGTPAAVSACATPSKVADFLGFGEVAERSIAAVLKTAPENTGKARKCANPLQILTESTAFPDCSRRTHRHRRRHMAWRYDAEKIERRRVEREQQAIAEMDAMNPKYGVCYFIGCEEGLVKIGYSANLNQRFNTIKSGSLYKLSILATANGGRSREAFYHHKFAEHRFSGEWFSRCPEIEAEIARLNGDS